MKTKLQRAAYTFVDVSIVLAITAFLAAVVIPQGRPCAEATRYNLAEFRLGELRCAVESYRAKHGSAPPVLDTKANTIPGLLDLGTSPDRGSADRGNTGRTASQHRQTFPQNPYTRTKAVRATTKTAIQVGDVTPGTAGGWLYNEVTGQIWLDSVPGFDL